MPSYDDAIAAIESGGRYDRLGPIIKKTGDRAYGKYQVMGSNIGRWTREALGRELTPQEFLASPEAQERVFQHHFGGAVRKYGPEGAARWWFAGDKGMNNPNARDPLGTTVASYGQRFMRHLGQSPAGGATGGLLSGPAPQAPQGGLLAQSSPAASAGLLGGIPMMFPQMDDAPAPAPMPPMRRRPIDMTALLALAGLGAPE